MVVGPHQRMRGSVPRRSMGWLWGIGGFLLCLLLLGGGGYWWLSQALGTQLTYQRPNGPIAMSEHGGDPDIVALLRTVKVKKSGGVVSLDYSPQPGDKYAFSYLSKSNHITKGIRYVTIPASGTSSHVEFSIQQETGFPDIDAIDIGLKRDGKYGSRIIPFN